MATTIIMEPDVQQKLAILGGEASPLVVLPKQKREGFYHTRRAATLPSSLHIQTSVLY